MPRISSFFGIVIYMYFKDHNPPHFYAKYGDYEVMITIKDGIIDGKFPKRALKLVLEWLENHKNELMDNWSRAQSGEELILIEPLE